MGPFVLDASIAATWAFPDERDPVADAALARLRSGEALVPGIWWYEVRNILVAGERRGRITLQQTTDFLSMMSRLRVLTDLHPIEVLMMDLARAHGLTVYDAAYLELAVRERVPLATSDKQLRRAAEARRVELLGA